MTKNKKPKAGFFYDAEGNTIGIGIMEDSRCKVLDMKGNLVAEISTLMTVSQVVKMILSKKERLVV